MINPEENANNSGSTFSKEDLLTLELLRKARERRDLDIAEAVRKALLTDNLAERDSNASGVLAEEAIRLHTLMRTISRRTILGRMLTRSRVMLNELHYPAEEEYPDRYKVFTSPLLATEPELVSDVAVTDGYVFETDVLYGIKKDRHPIVVIKHTVSDEYTGEQSTHSHPDYVIRVSNHDTKHPNAEVHGSAISDTRTVTVTGDDVRLLQPIGLIRLAIGELS